MIIGRALVNQPALLSSTQAAALVVGAGLMYVAFVARWRATLVPFFFVLGLAGDQLLRAAGNRLEIDGLDCTRVSKVEAITVKTTIVQAAVGELRDYQREPGKVEFPNLKITLAEAGSETWQAWFDDFVVRGNNDNSKEKKGSLTFFSPNLKDTLAQITFSNMGIFKFAREKSDSGTDRIRRIQAELYVERMQLIV